VGERKCRERVQGESGGDMGRRRREKVSEYGPKSKLITVTRF